MLMVASAMNLLTSTHTTFFHKSLICFHSTHIKNLSFFSFPSSVSLKSTHTIKTRRPLLSLVVSALGKLSDMESVPVPPESDAVSAVFPPASGVYAVYDKNGDMQFVGLSRNIQSSILYHQKSVPELCASIKVHTSLFPKKKCS